MPPLHPSIRELAMPARIARLPIDQRGYPVPWFVAWVNDQPDHRVIDNHKMAPALREHRCWICGDLLGRFLTFCLGPMCTITRTVSEPPAHLECARYAAQACPFMSRPHMVRRETQLPEGWQEPAGLPIQRNPGAICLWTTRSFRPFTDGQGGLLFRVGDPTSTAWYCEGRPATRAEVQASIDSGLPLLQETAAQEGGIAVTALLAQLTRALQYLPKEEADGVHAG